MNDTTVMDPIVRRILVLAKRDWLHAAASPFEVYLHEVFTRIAGQGHYVAWVAGADWPVPGRHKPKASVERMDGVHLARLGAGPMRRFMTGMMLRRLAAQREPSFDVAVDCVNGKPFPMPPQWNLPVLPLVHRLRGGAGPYAGAGGPVIATHEDALKQLTAQGVAARRIVRAPFGYPPVPGPEGDGRPRQGVAVFSRSPRRRGLYARALRAGDLAETPPVTILPSGGKVPEDVCPGPAGEAIKRHALAVCEKGCEHWARLAAAQGAVPVCPPTEAGALYTENGETGLLAAGRGAKALAGATAQLAGDAELQARLRAESLKRGAEWPWDRTAALVLATIENLEAQRSLRPAPL